MDSINLDNISGRGDFVGTGSVDDEGNAHLRIDDNRNPEFWLQIVLTKQDVERLASESRNAFAQST